MTEPSAEPLAERVAILESRQRDAATLSGWMTRVELLERELKHQVAYLETAYDELKEHVTGRVSKLDAELRGRVVQAEETAASFADRVGDLSERANRASAGIEALELAAQIKREAYKVEPLAEPYKASNGRPWWHPNAETATLLGQAVPAAILDRLRIKRLELLERMLDDELAQPRTVLYDAQRDER